jgi:signal transduction histidine kinase
LAGRNDGERAIDPRHSMKWRLVALLIGIVGAIILFCTIINSLFLEGYYERTKLDKLGDVYNKVNETYTGLTTDDVELTFEQLMTGQNISIYIYNTYILSSQIVVSVTYPDNIDVEMLKRDLQKYYFPDETFNGASYGIPSGGGIVRNRGNEKIVDNGVYKIYRRYDQRLEANYLELLGTLDSGDNVFIRTNFDNISESAGIANKFFAYVGLLGIVFGAIAMYITGDKFTKPLVRLTHITKEISELNFDVRYEEKRKDEIGVLGESINTLSDKLESTISELKSANLELTKDIEKKQQIDDMRREFLSDVTHELKTPIALIQGYAEGLKDNISDDEESRDYYCDVIIDESGKMNNMVKKLLTLSHIESGTDKVEFERFDINELITSVLRSMKMMFDKCEVVPEFNHDKPVFVWADEYHTEEVVTNYVSNALNHVEPSAITGKKEIRVTVEQENDKARISVYNTGEQIPEADIGKIWDKFYKVDKARTRAYGGSGIGLSIVKAIMESMNQDFGVKNMEDGVLFYFELDMKS